MNYFIKIFVNTILSILIIMISCSKREIEHDKIQKRENELVYALYEEQPYSGKVVQFYSSGQKKFEIHYKNGVKAGGYRSWFENGQLEKEGHYKRGLESGFWIYWYPNGHKEKEGEFVDGTQKGTWNFWADDGRKMELGKVVDFDGNCYKTIKIGDQWWMSENLRVTHYRNGDSIPNVTDTSEWLDLSDGAYCNYNNDKEYALVYGRLYNWYAVTDDSNIAPIGWHVPTDDEWKQLEIYLGMSRLEADGKRRRNASAGAKMKSIGTLEDGTGLWLAPNPGATNESGLSVLPGGWRSATFHGLHEWATFWTSSKYLDDTAWMRDITNYFDICILRKNVHKDYGFSVRCVKD